MEQKLTILPETKNYTPNDVLKEIKECVNLLVAIGYTSMSKRKYQVAFSERRVKNFATCQYISGNLYKIVLNANYVRCAAAENVHNTIMHEVIHSVPGCMNHGAPWKRVAADVNANYKYTPISRLGYDEAYHKNFLEKRPSAKYILMCGECKKEWKYQRKTKTFEAAQNGHCMCPYCKSRDFKLITL